MRKIAFWVLLFITVTTFNNCKKGGNTKSDNSANADIAGNYQLASYIRDDSKEYTVIEFPCLSTNKFVIETDNKTEASSTTGIGCEVTPPPTGILRFYVGGGRDTARSTYVRTSNNLVFSFRQTTGTIVKSYGKIASLNGKVNLTVKDTLNSSFTGSPIYITSVYVKL